MAGGAAVIAQWAVLSGLYPVLSTRYSVPGTQYSVLSTQYGGSQVARFISYVLFVLTAAMALVLAALVVVAPWLSWINLEPEVGKLIRLFSDDRIVRRTALASALGLFVTGWVFFRPARTRHC